MCTKQPKSGFSTSPPERLDETLFSAKDKVALIINLCVLAELSSRTSLSLSFRLLLIPVFSNLLAVLSYRGIRQHRILSNIMDMEAPVPCVFIGRCIALTAAIRLFLGMTFCGHNIPLKSSLRSLTLTYHQEGNGGLGCCCCFVVVGYVGCN